jgi:DNA-binding PucR family transcriptional regulator
VTSERIVEFAEGLARIAAAGGGPKALAAHLAAQTGGGVLLEDAQWRHLAAAGSSDLPASARAVVESGAPGRCVRVVAGSTHLGWLSMFAGPDDAGEHLLRLTAAAIAVELARDAGTGRGRRRTFWERLLAGAYHDASAARDDAAAHGVAPAAAYLAIALEAESAAEPHRPAEPAELRALATGVFRAPDADTGFLERGAALLVFVPATREVDASNARTAAKLLPKSASKRRTQLRISGGVGRVETLLALQTSAQSALAALDIGRRIYGPGYVSAYDELGSYPLLYEGANVARMARYAQSVLAPLRAYDEKHQTELERTLKLYFAVGENVKTAAAQLNVHRHTIFYRLRQIGEICGCSLESPHDQLTLRMAVAIDALHS